MACRQHSGTISWLAGSTGTVRGVLQLAVTHSDACPFARRASDLQVPSVETGDLEAQGKAEACAALPAGTGFIDHIEGLCDPGKLLRGNADPFILYKDPGSCSGQADAGTGRAGFAGVVDKVG